MSGDDARLVMNWHEERQHAETRPAMYIGSQEMGHKLAVREVPRLVWQAKVFRRPQVVAIDLSPTQYVVRAECGPLIRPVQQIFSFGTGSTLGEHWRDEMSAYREQQETGIHKRDWRYCFSGPTGPHLDWLCQFFILARNGVWGLRTNGGLWCEAYQEGVPTGKPFLLSDLSPIGLMSAASLDPQWYTGLPFTEEDARLFAGLSHSRVVGHRMCGPHPNWTYGEIITRWHQQDDLISERTLTAEGVRELL